MMKGATFDEGAPAELAWVCMYALGIVAPRGVCLITSLGVCLLTSLGVLFNHECDFNKSVPQYVYAFRNSEVILY